jgi:hypothetical protein
MALDEYRRCLYGAPHAALSSEDSVKVTYLLAFASLPLAASAQVQQLAPGATQPSQNVDPLRDTPDEAPSHQVGGAHAGLFLRAALGAGRFIGYNKSLTASGDRRSFSGTSGSVQLAIGGTLRGKLVMGGAYGRDQIFGLASEDTRLDGDEPNLSGYSMILHSTGYFLDYYLGPQSGTHIQLMMGAATIDVQRPDGSSLEVSPLGLYGQLGVGHELWLTDSLLLGGLAAVSHAQFSVDELPGSDVKLRSFVPGLYLSLTVN